MALSRDELLSWLRYDAVSGRFFWIRSPAVRAKVGCEAGHCNGDGYREIELRGKVYQAHRLAWLFEYGCWPVNELDHINGVRDDNRIVNLRNATKSQNQHNRKQWSKQTSSRFKGVAWHRVTGKWAAGIQANKKRIYLGLFATEQAAHLAYAEAANRLHGEFARLK